MGRFKISYTLDKNLKPEEVDINESKEVKITDIMGELPDLVVADENTARKYIDYFNQPKKEQAINQTFKFIHGELDRIDDMNSKLIRPEETVYYTDDDNGEPALFQKSDTSFERFGDPLTLKPGAYGIDLVYQDDEYYVPLQLISDFILTNYGGNVVYNTEAVCIVYIGRPDYLED